jgi:hypothetical protein
MQPYVDDHHPHNHVWLIIRLADEFGDGCFDGTSIACRALDSPSLIRAMTFLDVTLAKGGQFRRLTKPSIRNIERWLRWAVGREFGIVRIDRDQLGWCRIRPPRAVRERIVYLLHAEPAGHA